MGCGSSSLAESEQQPQQQKKQEQQVLSSGGATTPTNVASHSPSSSRSGNRLVIYGMGGSTCTQRVIMSALENNADFDLKLVDLRKGEHKTPAHLARQPFGIIPALSEENDPSFVLYESRAIARYVNDSRGNKLIPVDAKKRTIMEQWISLEQGTITPEVSGIVAQRIFAPMFGGKADDEIVKKHVEKAQQGLDIMDAHLAKNVYLAGDSFSLADVFFMPYFNMALMTPEKEILTSRPNIAAWWKRVSGRASWIKAQEYNEFLKA